MNSDDKRGSGIPRATYRVQLHGGFDLAAAEALLPHLAELGVSHLYSSPLLKARPGSTHGYDVIDPASLNPEIGDDAAFERFCVHLRDLHLGLLLDIVPNHMGVLEADNPWWLDVLAHGPASVHAAAFDIEWTPPQRELHGKLLLPVLGERYGAVLEAGEISVRFEPGAGRFELRYFKHRFPIDPRDHAGLLNSVPVPAQAGTAQRTQLEALANGFALLPARDDADPVRRASRQRDSAALHAELSRLHAHEPWAPAWLRACAEALQGQPGDARSWDALDALLQRQAYRLAHWRTAGDELNYRRFFDINGLAGLRVEDDAVFDALHERVLAWVAAGRVDGLRIDHPDGMADPEAYFRRLAQRCAEVLAPPGGAKRAPPPPEGVESTRERPFVDSREAAGRPGTTYLVAEKILGDDEPWPRDWPLHGETGYRFANQANAVFVDGEQAAALDAVVEAFTGAPLNFEAELDAAKRAVMNQSLAADLRLLTERAHDIALANRHTRDLTRAGLSAAIVAMAASFDVYRSYVSPRGAGPQDRARIEKAAAAARNRVRPSLAGHVDFIRQLLLQAPDEPDNPDPALRARQLAFVQRLQQFTAPVMAKSMEDTAFYRHHRLVSLNDVGGDPRRFGLPVPDFHAATLQRLRETPHTLLASSTHDSKRSEDVRTRLDVLSEMPQRWAETLQRWRELAQTQWRIGGLAGLPAASDELLLFQTLAGVWPTELAHSNSDSDSDSDNSGSGSGSEALADLRERVTTYMLKAVREAKQHSSWLDENDDYEQGLTRCIELLLARLEPNPFLSDMRRFVAEIAPFGCLNSLALVTLKLTAPGVPDIYQGCEDWRFMLVDPDNRRPVDPARLRERLAQAQAWANDPATLRTRLRTEPLPGGLHKLFITWRLLQWRREAETLLRDGDYLPLEIEGPDARHVIAFARVGPGGEASITIVPRLAWTLGEGRIETVLAHDWHDTAVRWPADLAGDWRDVLATPGPETAAGRDGTHSVSAAADALPLGMLLADGPIAVLHRAAR
jgi:(1->4)-alpha-D-glucan 1-alpha-D-glucosylmutase